MARKRMFNGGMKALGELVMGSDSAGGKVLNATYNAARSTVRGAGNIAIGATSAVKKGLQKTGDGLAAAERFLYKRPPSLEGVGARVKTNMSNKYNGLRDKLADTTDFEAKLQRRSNEQLRKSNEQRRRENQNRKKVARERYIDDAHREALTINQGKDLMDRYVATKRKSKITENVNNNREFRKKNNGRFSQFTALEDEVNKSVALKRQGSDLMDRYAAAKAKGVETTNQTNAYFESLNKRNVDGGVAGMKETAGVLKDNFVNHFFGENGDENLKRAFRQTVKSSAISAAAHGGIAALQGDDVWEGAKTGAFRGALGAGLYQGAKGATGANTGSIWGNTKHIMRTTKDMYNATTVAGREALQKNGMSGSLATLMRARQTAKISKPQQHTL